MENFDIPPFYIDQEVTANQDHDQGVFKKGDEFKITDVFKAPCNNWNSL